MKDRITPDLVAAALRNDSCAQDSEVRQFRSIATARQYRWPYLTLQRFVRAGTPVLDWGCGNGHFCQFLLLAGYKTSGYAFGPPSPLVARLEERHPDRMKFSPGSEEDPVTLPYSAESFSAVTSVGVLEHVRETGGDEVASLREIHRVLTPDGVFCCFHFPNRYSWIEALTYFFPSRHHHQFRYTKKDIHRLAKESGFEVVCVRRYNVLPRNMFVDLAVRFGDSRVVATLVDWSDSLLSVVLNPLAQNYGFVLRKRPQTTSSV